jgi:hypothetical protein
LKRFLFSFLPGVEADSDAWKASYVPQNYSWVSYKCWKQKRDRERERILIRIRITIMRGVKISK